MRWTGGLVVVALSVLPVMAPAMAQEASPPASVAGAPAGVDTAALQSVIRDQLEAFQHDDGAKAYGFAAPNVREIFPTPDLFMAMVRTGYPPVYRPRSYRFDQLEQKSGQWVQTVEIVGPDGDFWTAAYSLVQQSDGSWKIAGCVVVKAPGSSA